MRRKWFFLALVLCAAPLLALAAPFSWLPDAQAPAAAEEPLTHGLRVELKPATQTVKVGQEVSFEVSFVNNGPDEIEIIRPLDGSEARWQQPYHDFLASRDGGPTLRWTMVGGRGPRMAALSRGDVVTIEDQGRVDPRQGPHSNYLQKITFAEPGTYRVWYLYFFERATARWDIDGTPASVPHALHGTFTSNAVTVKVLAAGE